LYPSSLVCELVRFALFRVAGVDDLEFCGCFACAEKFRYLSVSDIAQEIVEIVRSVLRGILFAARAFTLFVRKSILIIAPGCRKQTSAAMPCRSNADDENP
jgi:hypothetical protein